MESRDAVQVLEELEEAAATDPGKLLGRQVVDKDEENVEVIHLVKERSSLEGSVVEELLHTVHVRKRKVPAGAFTIEISECSQSDLLEHALLVETPFHKPLEVNDKGFTNWQVGEWFAYTIHPQGQNAQQTEFQAVCSSRLQWFDTPFSQVGLLCPLTTLSQFLWFLANGFGYSFCCFKLVLLTRKIRPITPSEQHWRDPSCNIGDKQSYRLKFVGPWHVQPVSGPIELWRTLQDHRMVRTNDLMDLAPAYPQPCEMER